MSIPTDLFINSISTFKNFRETRYSTLYCTSRKLLLFFSQAIPFRRFFFSLSSLFPLHYYYCLLFVSSLLRVARFSLRYLFSLLTLSPLFIFLLAYVHFHAFHITRYIIHLEHNLTDFSNFFLPLLLQRRFLYYCKETRRGFYTANSHLHYSSNILIAYHYTKVSIEIKDEISFFFFLSIDN